jgi:hypothetical protein
MAAVDDFKNKSTKDNPYTTGEAVTPSDSVELTKVSRALALVNSGAQTLAVVMADGTSLSGLVLPTGIHRLRVKQVKSTGTTVTNIVALS